MLGHLGSLTNDDDDEISCRSCCDNQQINLDECFYNETDSILPPSDNIRHQREW